MIILGEILYKNGAIDSNRPDIPKKNINTVTDKVLFILPLKKAPKTPPIA